MRTLTAISALTLAAAAASANYPRAGWQAELSTLAHGVSGTVTIVDEDTIQVDRFNYDGRGLDVRFYLAEEQTNNSFRNGLPIGPQLLGPPFVDASLTVDLPTGFTLDGFNAISVWCVDVNASFGDGTFYCPADFDKSGDLNSQDFVAYLNAFTAGDDSADFNGDGSVNSIDFAAYLNAFVAGC